MAPGFNHIFFIFITIDVTLHLDYCPTLCQCDPDIHSVSCFGSDVMPVFHDSTEEVWLVGTKLSFIPQDAFSNLANISHIYIFDDDTLRYLERHSFHNLSWVTHIEVRGTKTLSYIDPEAFKDLPNLKYLGIVNTGLSSFPALHWIQSSQDDFILEIVDNVFIQVIPSNAFTGISVKDLTIYLHRNVDLEQIDEFAFYGAIHGPSLLDLSETRVRALPLIGMETIEKLQATNTWALKVLPPLTAFLHLQMAELTFPSHCCGLKMLQRWSGHTESLICNLTKANLEKLQTSPVDVSQRLLEHRMTDGYTPPTTGSPGHNHDYNNHFGPFKQCEKEDVFYVESHMEHPNGHIEAVECNKIHTGLNELSCSPLPDFFNPCEDVMSQGFLRVSVWVVGLLAILANLLVMFILLTSHQRLFVSSFLMGNLAFADFCMGMYLLVIASVDLYTRSHYYHYAITWQTGTGCNLAGMLSVFASELSVYTLTVISIQRWHAIFYAMRPQKKLRFRHAAVLVLVGWLLCLTLGLLPVVGVNSYQKVSICLPMDTETTAARIYVVSVLMVNVLAFIVVCLCYFHIYCMVHNPQHQSSRYDTSMAKRMAVLIFANFLCLAPICFYGLSAALHQPLITITDFKVLLVLFYPLNSCVHPFFYAILTKSFHHDILMLLSRMGLCQHQAHLYRSQLVRVPPN